MAILRNGILGSCSGKIGNMVFYTVNGKQMARSVGKYTKPPTEKQLQNQMELGVVTTFLKPIMVLINAGFGLMANGSGKSPYNLAVGFNKKQAMQGVYPDVEMAYEKVLVTRGNMWGAIAAGPELTNTGLSFSWESSASLQWSRQSDQVMLLAYFPAKGLAVYELAGPKRSALAAVLPIPEELLTAYMEVYIAFVAEDRKQISDSSYLGNFNKM